MAIDRKFLDANHADLVAQIRAEGQVEGTEEGRAQGAQAERARIQSVEAQALPGHEALIATLKFDGKTSGPEAAMQILAAEKQKGAARLELLRKDGPDPAPPAPSASGDPSAGLAAAEAAMTVEERAKAQFARDPKIRAEFDNVERYTGWLKHEAERQAA